MHPARRHRFHRADDIREAMRRPQADEQMNVVVNATDRLRDSAEVAHDAAEIRVQPFTPRGDDEWAAFLRAKDDVIVEREVCGWHGRFFQRPCRDARIFSAIRWLTPPANFDAALRASAPLAPASCAVDTNIVIPSTLHGAGRELRRAFTAQLDQPPKPDFIRAYTFPGLHPDGYEDAESGWPRVLRRFAAEAWRRADAGELADEELYPCDAQWAGIYDRLGVTTAEENQRRVEIAAHYGERADG